MFHSFPQKLQVETSSKHSFRRKTTSGLEDLLETRQYGYSLNKTLRLVTIQLIRWFHSTNGTIIKTVIPQRNTSVRCADGLK